jgi:hypothetical protein
MWPCVNIQHTQGLRAGELTEVAGSKPAVQHALARLVPGTWYSITSTSSCSKLVLPGCVLVGPSAQWMCQQAVWRSVVRCGVVWSCPALLLSQAGTMGKEGIWLAVLGPWAMHVVCLRQPQQLRLSICCSCPVTRFVRCTGAQELWACSDAGVHP